MRVIALMNQKGGVGKTTTTANLGAALAELGLRVCLIDLDPQSHLTINYGLDPAAGDGERGIYGVLVDGASLAEAMQKIDERLCIVPSSIDLAAAEIELVSVLGREKLLKDRLGALEAKFDFMLLDCPPSLGLLTINALAAAHEVIIPMQPHFLALQGVGKLLETVGLIQKRLNSALRVAGIVLTMFDAQTKLSGEIVNDLASFIENAKGRNLPWSDAVIYQSKIRRNIKLAESPSFGQTILTYESSSNGAADYRALAREVAAIPAIAGASAPQTPTNITAPRTARRKAYAVPAGLGPPPSAIAANPAGPAAAPASKPSSVAAGHAAPRTAPAADSARESTSPAS